MKTNKVPAGESKNGIVDQDNQGTYVSNVIKRNGKEENHIVNPSGKKFVDPNKGYEEKIKKEKLTIIQIPGYDLEMEAGE